MIDMAMGGTSLLVGAGIGAAVGAAGAIVGAGRLAKIEVLGRPLGGYDLKVGPMTDPNLPWVLLARALLHVQLIAERNHARREALVIAATRRESPGTALDVAARRQIDALFRQIRRADGDDARAREALAKAIADMLEML